MHPEGGGIGQLHKEQKAWNVWFVIVSTDIHPEKHACGRYKKKQNAKTMGVDFVLFLNSFSLSMWAQLEAPAVNEHVLCLGMWL